MALVARSYHPAAPPAPNPALISPSVSVLQTDFEKDVDLACRSGERLTGESHGGQSAHLLLSLLPASVCLTCPHPTPAATWPSLSPLLKGFRSPVGVAEGAPESCCGAHAGLAPSLVAPHLSVSPFFPHRAEQMGQSVRPSPAPASVCTLTVTCLLPALPHAPMFCLVFVSSLLTWGSGGAGCALRGGDLCGSRKKARGRNCYWGSQLKLSFLEAKSRRYSVPPTTFLVSGHSACEPGSRAMAGSLWL